MHRDPSKTLPAPRKTEAQRSSRQPASSARGVVRMQDTMSQQGVVTGAIHAHGPEQDALSWFLGKWHITGYNEPLTPGGRRTTVSGLQEYEWLPGQFFLLGRFSHHFAERSHSGISVLGFEPERQAYVARNFDNLGYAREYSLEPRDRAWLFVGEGERAMYLFGEGQRSYREHWELTQDGLVFRTLCVLEATKLG